MPRTPGSKNTVKKPKLHRLIAALIDELPPAGAKWDTEGRVKWLKAMGDMFDFAYGVNGDAHARLPVLAVPQMAVPNGKHIPNSAQAIENFIGSLTGDYVIDPEGNALLGTQPIDPSDIPPGTVVIDYRQEDSDYSPVMWKTHGAKKMPLPPGVQLRTATEPWIDPRLNANVETP